MQLKELTTIEGRREGGWEPLSVKAIRDWFERPTTTHLYMDLDRERDALFNLFGFLVEVLAELSDRDPSLDGKKRNKHGK